MAAKGRKVSTSILDDTTDHQHGGETCAANGDPLCNLHNPFKNHGCRITRDEAGCWHTYRPDGTEITTY